MVRIVSFLYRLELLATLKGLHPPSYHILPGKRTISYSASRETAVSSTRPTTWPDLRDFKITVYDVVERALEKSLPCGGSYNQFNLLSFSVVYVNETVA